MLPDNGIMEPPHGVKLDGLFVDFANAVCGFLNQRLPFLRAKEQCHPVVMDFPYG
jgi:hypothetical protein